MTKSLKTRKWSETFRGHFLFHFFRFVSWTPHTHTFCTKNHPFFSFNMETHFFSKSHFFGFLDGPMKMPNSTETVTHRVYIFLNPFWTFFLVDNKNHVKQTQKCFFVVFEKIEKILFFFDQNFLKMLFRCQKAHTGKKSKSRKLEIMNEKNISGRLKKTNFFEGKHPLTQHPYRMDFFGSIFKWGTFFFHFQ